MRNLVFLIVFLLHISSEARTILDVYLGITAPGPEIMSAGGHAVLVVNELTATGEMRAWAYSYFSNDSSNEYVNKAPQNMQNITHAVLSLLEVASLGVKRLEYSQYLSATVYGEGRSLRLLKLKLSTDQKNKIAENIENDYANLTSTRNNETYSLQNSCLTHAIALINTVLDSNQQITYSDVSMRDLLFQLIYNPIEKGKDIASLSPYAKLPKLLQKSQIFEPADPFLSEHDLKLLVSHYLSKLRTVYVSECTMSQSLADSAYSLALSLLKVNDFDRLLELLYTARQRCPELGSAENVFIKISEHVNKLEHRRKEGRL